MLRAPKKAHGADKQDALTFSTETLKPTRQARPKFQRLKRFTIGRLENSLTFTKNSNNVDSDHLKYECTFGEN